jgi:hypothetical protein
MVVKWSENLVQFEPNPPRIFPGGNDAYSPDEREVSQSMDDLIVDNESIPTLEEELSAPGLWTKPFSSIRNMFDDTGNDDLILDMSMDTGDDFNTSSRSMANQAVQESSRNLISAPIPTGAGSTAA